MSGRAGRWTGWPLALPVLLFLGLFLVYPVAHSIGTALSGGGGGFDAIVETFDPVIVSSLWHSLALGGVVTAAAIGVGTALAWVMTRYRFHGRGLLSALLFVPMILPPFVGALGAKRLLGRFGTVNLWLMDLGILNEPIDWLGGSGFWGVAAMEVLHLFPIAYLNIVAAMASVDPALEEAAGSLGASARRTFRTVTWPLIRPGVFAGSAIIFIWAFTDLGTPLIFDYHRVVSVQIFWRVNEAVSNPDGHILVMVVLAITLLLFYASKRMLGGSTAAMQTKGSGPGRRERRLGPLGTLAAIGFVGGILALGIIPHAGVLLNATQEQWFMTPLPESYTTEHLEAALTHRVAILSIRNSLLYSGGSMVVDLLLGVTVAYLITRTRLPGRGLLDGLSMLPLALPGLVLAFGYVAAFHGGPLDPRVDPTLLLVAAYAVRRLPFVVRAAVAGFQQVPQSLEEASASLGASGWRTVRCVTGPLIAGHVAAGAVMAFVFAMLEVSDSLILAFDEAYYPITKAIFLFAGRLVDGPYIASAMGLVCMAILLAGLLVAARLMGKKMGQMFRVG